MKKLLIALAASGCTIVPGLRAQETGISGSFGGAAFRMDDLKYLQEYILGTFPVEGKVISSFPPYYSGSVSLVRQWFPTVRIGAGYVRTITGARSNYTDYSGSLHNDFTATSHRFGAFVTYGFARTDKLELSLCGRIDGNLSRVDITTSLYVLGTSSGTINKYNAFSPSGYAGLELLYHFSDFSVGIDGGYLVEKPGELSARNSGGELTDPADRRRTLTTDWTGWRTGIQVLIWLTQ